MELCKSKVHKNEPIGEANSTASPFDFILDGMVWSFTRVNAYATCPKMFKLSYIDCESKLQNAFAEWGTLCHGILEDYFNGKITLLDMTTAYDDRFGEVVKHNFPFKLRAKYRESGKTFFDSFAGLPDGYEVLGVEQKVDLRFKGRPFVGYIDLLLRDKSDGKIILVDHKSKSKFNTEAEKSHYLMQLYLYSQYVYERYGQYPKLLVFNMFRAGTVVTEEFRKEAFDSAVRWLNDTIDSIYRDVEFSDKICLECMRKRTAEDDFKHSDFFCNELCSVRSHCERSVLGESQ